MKRKLEKIEDAEIIASKEVEYDNRFVLGKVNKLQTQLIVFFVFFLLFIIMSLGFLTYNQYNRTAQITNLQKTLKTLTPGVSFEFIDNALNDRELELQKQTIILIDQSVKNLEEALVDKFNSVTKIDDNRASSKFVKDELFKLQLKFDKKIAEVNKTNNEKIETFLTKGSDASQSQIILDNLDSKVQRNLNILSSKLTEIEKKVSLLKNEYLNIKFSSAEKSKRSQNINIKTLRELEQSFVKIAYNSLKEEAKRNIGGNRWSRFVSTIDSFFVFRSTKPKEGDTLDSILSRAEHMLRLRDFEGCLKELETLDKASLELFSEWVKTMSILINITN